MPYKKIRLIGKIAKAYALAEAAHVGQRRRSGDAYISHPMALIEKLNKVEADEDTQIAALLHDVLEDSDYTKDDIKRMFGESVSIIVYYLSKDEEENKEKKMRNYIKKLKTGFKENESVYLVKLMDQLHNTETLKYFDKEKQKIQAKESIEFYFNIFCDHLYVVNPCYKKFCLEAILQIERNCRKVLGDSKKVKSDF